MPQRSINQIVTLIASHLKRELDEPFKRMMAAKVDQWRSTLVSRSLEKHPDQREFFTQTLWVPMQYKSPIPCNVPIPICNEMWSKGIIPVPLRFGNTLFDYVGSIDGNTPFHFTATGTFQYLASSKYSGNDTFWTYTNKYIGIKNSKSDYDKKPLPMLMVKGVFDNPLDILRYNCQKPGCDFWNDPYPATNDIVQMITQYILEVDYGKKLNNEVSDPPRIEVNPDQPENE